MTLEGLKIGIGVTGSHCSFEQVYNVLLRLKDQGADLYPIMSFAASSNDSRFGLAADWNKKFMDLTGKPIVNTIADAEPIGPTAFLDIMVVAPCTGNTVARMANGITDTPVTMACKAHLRNGKPVVIAMATNDGLGANLKNVATLLNSKNIYFVPFGQDNAIKKPNSLVCNFDLIPQTVEKALEGKQLQPVLL